MSILKRIFFFILINVAVVAVLMTITTVFGIEPYITPYGLNLTSLAIWAAIIGFAGSFISLFISKWMAKSMMGVKLIDKPKSQQEIKVVEIITRIAGQNGHDVPEIGTYPSPEVNAFATGWGRNHSLVAVSAGLLNQMSSDELEGVLAHEMSHIQNGDMVTMALLQGVINTFVIFAARVIAYAITSRNESLGRFAYFGVSIVLEIVLGILASTIVFWFSRRREYAADADAATAVGRGKMIAALRRLQSLQGSIDTRQKSFATMKISDRPSAIGLLFSTHPQLRDRIKALEGRL